LKSLKKEQQMKIGVSAFAWTSNLNPSHTRLFPALRAQGLEGFEIPMFDPVTIDAANLRRAFQANDLECTVCAILPAGINPISPDAAVRTRSLAHLTHCVETCAELGAHLMAGPVYAPIGYLPGHRRQQNEWTWAVECFQSLGDVLEAHQVTLALEPVNRSESFFLNTAAEANALCAEIAHQRVGVTIDTFHANIEEKKLAESLRPLGKRLKHIHASENDRGLLGTGHVDFPCIVKMLKEMDYDGSLMIEGFGYSTQEPESLGALYADPSVSPEDIAFKGATYLRSLLG
jgi:D-psicose/D-tagatose/L-ribulose 3-epimerase